MIKGIIFDLDGTLLDSMSVWEEIDMMFLQKRGIDIPKDYSETLLNMHFETAAIYTIERFGLDETPEAVMAEWMRMAEKKYQEEVPLKKGAEQWLKIVKEAGVLMGITTSCKSQLFIPCLTRLGILDYFSIIVETGQVGVTKEQPLIYQKILETWKIRPQECLVLDDVFMALNTACQIGCPTIAILDESSKEDWIKMKKISQKVIHDFSGLSIQDLKGK